VSRAKKPTKAAHVFVVDQDTPGDPVSGAGVCARCHLVGRPGDAHHDMPGPVPDPRTGDDT
jgi:hypothetical protein